MTKCVEALDKFVLAFRPRRFLSAQRLIFQKTIGRIVLTTSLANARPDAFSLDYRDP